MAITRTAWTDDDGTGTTGTLINNAAKTTLYDELDARWSEITVTSTGSQNNVSITTGGIEADIVHCFNASDLTITGFAAPASPAKPGKPLIVISTGVGNVYLAHNSGSSSAGNKLFNQATSSTTPLAAGKGYAIYTYASVAARWQLVAHDQGAAITPTFADSHYTGAGVDGDWALASGDRITQSFYLKGTQLFVAWALGTTTVANTPATLRITNAAWGGFTSAKQKARACIYDDNAGGNTIGYAAIAASGTEITINKLTGGTFANATNTTAVSGDLDFEVT
jgi:hypothetical protein